jgi:pimeloyl-ACP methyl ester carboxylesterase
MAISPLAARPEPPWLVLPPTPTLPKPVQSGLAPVDGIMLWHATFGPASGLPVVLLHGGLANSDYFGLLVPALAKDHPVIVIDSRGHGRSGRNATPLSYDLMAQDALALLDRLHIQKAAFVGWSDGAITGLAIAIHHPECMAGLFAFGANSDPSGVADVRASKVFMAFIARAGLEYKRLNPTPDGFASFDTDIEKMWAREPNLSKATLNGIRAHIWIVDGDHEEAIVRANTDLMAREIPDARELILPGVSHFAFLQDPDMFAYAVRHFLGSLYPRAPR